MNQDVDFLERETGIEPATFSLGRRQSIGNKEHSVSSISFWRLRIPVFRSFCCTQIKRSTNGAHGVELLDIGHVRTFVKASLQIPESNRHWENHVIG
jgi:hypothetical protein